MLIIIFSNYQKYSLPLRRTRRWKGATPDRLRIAQGSSATENTPASVSFPHRSYTGYEHALAWKKYWSIFTLCCFPKIYYSLNSVCKWFIFVQRAETNGTGFRWCARYLPYCAKKTKSMLYGQCLRTDWDIKMLAPLRNSTRIKSGKFY